MNCPNCGHTTPPSTTGRCGHCNFKLPANSRPQAAPSNTTLPCWNCRHPNAAEAERCEQCNAKTLAQPTVPFSSRNPVYPQTSKPVKFSNHVQ